MLKYLSYTAEGDGEKVLYMLCGAQCPRCAQMYNAFADEPRFKQEYQVRWVLWPGSDAGYLFPLENKPGAGIKELYGNPQQIEPRPVENPARLNTMAAYNGMISGMVGDFFNGRPSVNATPFIVIKTQDGFEYGSVEDFWKDSAIESFSKALPLPAGVNIYDSGIMKDVEKAEKLVGHIFFAVEKDVPLRLFPRDDAPLVGDPIPKGLGRKVRTKTSEGWVGIQIYQDPDAPLAYARLIAVRLRGNKKVQNLSSMWYKKLPQQLATQGDFGLEPSYYTLLSTAIPDTGTCF